MAGRFRCCKQLRAFKCTISVFPPRQNVFTNRKHNAELVLQGQQFFVGNRCLASSQLLEDSVLKYGNSKVKSVQDSTLNLGGFLSYQLQKQVLQSCRHISSTAAIQHQEIGMPSLSPTMTQGNIAKWCKKEGDQVAPGDVLCEIETDKATLEMEAMDEGFLAKILCSDGTKDIPVGQPIAVIVDSEEEIAKFKDYKAETGDSSPPPPKDQKSQPPKEEEAMKSSPAPPATSPSKSKSEPSGQDSTKEKKSSLTSTTGMGPNGQSSTKAYAEEFRAPEKLMEKPAHSLDYTDVPNTQIKRITAQRLLLSKQSIPHYYLIVHTKVDELLLLRSKLNDLQEASGGKKISINDFILKAAAMALRKVPECNSSWTDESIRQ